MLLPKFDFHQPAGLSEACQMMSEYGIKAKLLAGGTDLLVNMKHKRVSPAHLVSISKIGELKKLGKENGVIHIGSGFTVVDLIDAELINQDLSALSAGASALGSPLIRNLATIGGNIGSARPAADLPPSLMVYGAQAVLESVDGQRKVSMKDFFKGVGLTHLHPDEVIAEFQVPVPPAGAGAGYINLGVRQCHDCNVVNVASYIELERDDTIKTARIIMGCVGPTHLPSPAAENILMGAKPDETLFKNAAQAAKNDSRPIDDFRGTAEYKRNMVEVLTFRTLALALKEAQARA